MSPGQSVEYNWIDGVERLEKYEPGGYHPIMIDDLLDGRYRIVDKLGFGGYSTIWLAQDQRLKRFVAIKVGVSSPSLSRREPSILRNLSRSRPISYAAHVAIDASDAIPSILDEFDIQGPNGTHTCYTVAPAQGNLKEASFSRLFPIRVARALAAKLTMAVAFIHFCGFVHGVADIHIRNVLVKLPSTFDELAIGQFRKKFGEPETVPISRTDGRPLPPNISPRAVVPMYLGEKAQDFTLADAHGLILNDFGEAFAPAMEQRLGKDCNTPMAKKAPLGTAQIDVLGSQHFPSSWWKHWEQPIAEESDRDEVMPHRPTGPRGVWPTLEEAFDEFVQKYRRKRETAGVFEEEETRAILDLMRGMLKFRPEERLMIDEVLGSEWMVKTRKKKEKRWRGGLL
ncbi:kinase domain-containing protein [Colletotrichum zoysiae]|uniref:non-specific serine/threonine protein kinase n=1 Tax=Colletotrichum zoysiae TaxID=1216348 RepID=A0AAD9M858_9PEZI|nr:kinase domain-containing protein [Colletotrichum zoysiae]